MLSGTILCIDDHPYDLSILKDELSDSFSIKFALNGNSGIDFAIKYKPTLILLDYMMPGINGIETAKILKSNPETALIPIIFLREKGDTVTEEECFDNGAVDCITKPFNQRVLLARVKAQCALVQNTILEASHRTTIHMLGKAGQINDSDSGVHVWRMASYARVLAEAIGWDNKHQDLIEMAAPMHDVGKIGIPDSILKKPGKLSSDEWKIMKTHSEIGYQIMNKSGIPLFQMAADIAYAHHEKWDGTGYPRGLAGENIPESARIVAVADVFDALTTKKVYKEAWEFNESIKELESMSGNHLEPRLVKKFIEVLPLISYLKQEWDKKESNLIS